MDRRSRRVGPTIAVVSALGSNIASQWIVVRFRNKEARARTASVATPSTLALLAEGDDASGGASEMPAPSYLQLLVPVLLRFVQTDVPEKLREDLGERNPTTQMLAISLLEDVLKRARVFGHTAGELRDLQTATLLRLHRCVQEASPLLQLPLLRLLRLVVLRRHAGSTGDLDHDGERMRGRGAAWVGLKRQRSRFMAASVGCARPRVALTGRQPCPLMPRT